MAYNMYDSRAMTKGVLTLRAPENYLQKHFQSVNVYETRKVDIDEGEENLYIAEYTSPESTSVTINKEDFVSKEFLIPYTKEKMVTTATNLQKRSFGENIYVKPLSPAQRAQRQLGKDLITLGYRIDRLEEVQRAECLQTGKVTIRGKGVNRVVLSLDDTDHFQQLNGAAAWNNRSTAKPLDNLNDWFNMLLDNSNLIPVELLCGSKAVRDLTYNDEIKALLDIKNMSIGKVEKKALSKQKVAYWGHLADPGLDIYEYVAKYRNKLTGKMESYIHPDAVVMICADLDGRRHYGAIEDLDKNGTVTNNIVSSRFAKSWVEEEPSARFLLVQSAPLNLIHNKGYMSARVRDV